MKKNLYLMFASIVASILLFSCKKDDVSATAGNGGTAVFKLGGSPSGCAPATLTGSYTSGNALSPSNTVTLEVDVIGTGTYSFRTTSANGVYFSGSGSFSSTGTQTIVLTGQGTPIRAGSFVFATTNNSACNFNVDFSQGSGGGGGGTAAVFTYAGAPGNCTGAAPAGTYYNTVGLNANNYVDLNVNVTTIGTYNITTNSSKGISFSGAGVFTSTGAQSLRLTGQGTPNATGAATFTPTGGCSFNVTVAAAPAAGVFTYNCAIPPQVLGTYTAGTVLNNTNTIVIAVNVTTAGSYSVTTAAANGVTFSGSGVFAATGASTITLSSTSTPTAAGNFNYTPSGTGGCGFSVTYTGSGGVDFLKCSVNGGAIRDFNDLLTGGLTPPSPPFGYNFDVSGGILGGVEELDINIEKPSAITNGIYPNATALTLLDGSTISYIDPSGSTWNSSLLIANTSTVTITFISANKAVGSFTGRVYDAGGTGTNFKTLTGTFSISY